MYQSYLKNISKAFKILHAMTRKLA